ncbi:hypothetical protein BcDW1_6736 [Botrytis cinerea BcDW1]|uniref:Uncharacterized protein n=1 Tax=Botryotinia fuckeliana (strain BcDW1) TaxID=1290391 RepID=M7ULY3_BOTF1|nr:hypothetical protein BcDW1_6736 [Botrytis cinerea BcDW1]
MSQLSAPKENGSRTNTKDKTKDKTKIKSKIKTKDMTKIKTKNNTQLSKALDSEMSPQINNLQSFDPFAEAGDVDLKQAKKIHVRAQLKDELNSAETERESNIGSPPSKDFPKSLKRRRSFNTSRKLSRARVVL